MSVTIGELDRFHDFAISVVTGADKDLTWLQLIELWCVENPSTAEYQENVAAIRESLTAMDAGRMRSFTEFDTDFRKRHGIMSET